MDVFTQAMAASPAEVEAMESNRMDALMEARQLHEELIRLEVRFPYSVRMEGNTQTVFVFARTQGHAEQFARRVRTLDSEPVTDYSRAAAFADVTT